MPIGNRVPRAGNLPPTASTEALALAALADVVWTAWPLSTDPAQGLGTILAKGLAALGDMVYGGGRLAQMTVIRCADRATAERVATEIQRQEAETAGRGRDERAFAAAGVRAGE